MNRRAASTRDALLGVVAALALVAAVILYLRGGSGGDLAPDDEFISFYCPTCDEFFDLSHRDFEALWDRGDFGTVPGKSGMRFRCPKCEEMVAVRRDRAHGKPTDDTAPSRTVPPPP